MVKILIADDHELLRHGVRRLLEAQSGWKVVAEAVDGQEAVRLAAEERPDVAILDLSMGEVGGLEATRRIGRFQPKIAVIILTMHESAQVAQEILNCGARGYVLKSDAAVDLRFAITKVLSGHLAFPAHLQQSLVMSQVVSPLLSPREVQILRRLTSGIGTKDIAVQLFLSVKTVETHRSHIMRKLNLSTLTELIYYAVRQGLVSSWRPSELN